MMASKITEQEVKHVAELAKLEFPQDELEQFTTQLGSIIDMFEEYGRCRANDERD